MAGVVSPSMWMFVVEDAEGGGTSYCSLNEGLGKVLRYGAYGPEVIERLRWMAESLGPALQRRRTRARPGRPAGDHGAGAAHGRRAAQPQPRGDLAVRP